MNQIQEKTPHYIVTLKSDLIKHFDTKIEKEVGNLAAMTAREFIRVNQRFEDIEEKMATKDSVSDMASGADIKGILAHIGKYEVRTHNLEKEVFA
ncbi:MAG: hypothetical protein QG640_305 [Patescibacteria group bacterium]|nr:hypothetical protein [Patescibacteria group bacterium]